MAHKVWSFQLGGGVHTVELDHNFWSGQRAIQVDGVLVEQGKQFMDTGGEYPVQVAGQPVVVVIRYNGFAYVYDLVTNGRSLDTGQAVTLKGVSPGPVPGWAWGFIAACVLIPIVTLGGALPGAIGAGGAAGCAAIARDPSRETGTRVAICAGITVLSWVLFAVLLVAMGAMRAGR